jgi:hypothetical protein
MIFFTFITVFFTANRTCSVKIHCSKFKPKYQDKLLFPISQPLYGLLKNSAPVLWRRCEKAFWQLKQALAKAPMLAFPISRKNSSLHLLQMYVQAYVKTCKRGEDTISASNATRNHQAYA